MRHGNRRVRRDCCVIPSVSRRPRRFVCPRLPPEKARPHRTARIGPRSPLPAEDPRACGSRLGVVFESRRNIPSGVPLPSKESQSEALPIRGSKPGPSEVRQAPQITRVRDCRDVPYKLPSNAEFETSYAVFRASRGCLEGGSHRGRASSPRTQSNGSEPRLANPRKIFM